MTVGFVLLVPGALLLPIMVTRLLYASGSASVAEVEAPLFVGVVGGALTLLALRQLGRGWASRASDVIFEAEGIRFEGGLHHGFSLGWRDIEPDRWDVVAERGTVELRIPLAGEETFTLARSTSDGESASLGSIVETVTAACRAALEPPTPSEGGPEGTSCSRCGAPLTPADADVVTCAHCRHPEPIPTELRRRIRAAEGLEAAGHQTEALVARLLDQPTADATNVWLLLGACGCVGSLVATAALLPRFFLAGGSAYLIMAYPLAISLGVSCVAALRLANRRAAQLVTLHAGAISPSRPGDPYACCACAAPLRAAGDRLVVRCLHCDVANVVGIDLRRRRRDAGVERESLETALAARAQARMTSVLLALAGAAVAVIGTLLVLARY